MTTPDYLEVKEAWEFISAAREGHCPICGAFPYHASGVDLLRRLVERIRVLSEELDEARRG